MQRLLGPARRLISTSTNFSSSKFTGKELKSLREVSSPLRGHLPVCDVEEQSRLLVVMVGWIESRQSVLAKYAAIYTDLGLPCVTMAPGATRTWFSSVGKRDTKKMLHLLDDSLAHPVRVMYHLFSSGGSVIFPQILAEYGSSLCSKLIPAGVVFDSGPSLFSRKAGFAASKLIYQQGGFNFLTYSLANCVGFLTDLAIGSRKRSEVGAFLEHPELLQVPQLYLYSERDSVCPPERVRAVVESQRRMGRQVTSHCWTESDHVRHYPQYPDEYTQKIAEFLITVDPKSKT